MAPLLESTDYRERHGKHTRTSQRHPASVGVWTLGSGPVDDRVQGQVDVGPGPVKGHFTEFSGDGQITDTQTVFGRIDIKAASVDTKIRKRDEHLRSADFFEADKFPDISVVVTSAEAIDGDIVDLRAQLTIKGTTAPVAAAHEGRRCSTTVRCA